MQKLAAKSQAWSATYVQPPGTGTVFASMPLAEEFVDTLKAIRYAAKKVSLVAVRVDHDSSATDVVSRIKDGIRLARIVVVDLSGNRPSVLHEYGFAEALTKPIVAITSTGVGELPFNVRNNHTEQYVRGNAVPLRRLVLAAFRQEMARP